MGSLYQKTLDRAVRSELYRRSSWFFYGAQKGSLAQGQLAKRRSSPQTTHPEVEIKNLESVLTLVGAR